MRTTLLQHVDATGGEGLDPFTLEAIRTYRKDLAPGEKFVRP
jgi:hypothetical protein